VPQGFTTCQLPRATYLPRPPGGLSPGVPGLVSYQPSENIPAAEPRNVISMGTFRGRKSPRLISGHRILGPPLAPHSSPGRLDAQRGTLRPRNVPLEGDLGGLGHSA